MSDSLQPHELQHYRLPCPSLSPRVCSNSCPLSQWCYLIRNNFFLREIQKLHEWVLHISWWRNTHIKMSRKDWHTPTINPTPSIVPFSGRHSKLPAFSSETKGLEHTTRAPTFKTTAQLRFPNHLALKANRAYIYRTIAEKAAIVKGLESTPRWYA